MEKIQKHSIDKKQHGLQQSKNEKLSILPKECAECRAIKKNGSVSPGITSIQYYHTNHFIAHLAQLSTCCNVCMG